MKKLNFALALSILPMMTETNYVHAMTTGNDTETIFQTAARHPSDHNVLIIQDSTYKENTSHLPDSIQMRKILADNRQSIEQRLPFKYSFNGRFCDVRDTTGAQTRVTFDEYILLPIGYNASAHGKDFGLAQFYRNGKIYAAFSMYATNFPSLQELAQNSVMISLKTGEISYRDYALELPDDCKTDEMDSNANTREARTNMTEEERAEVMAFTKERGQALVKIMKKNAGE